MESESEKDKAMQKRGEKTIKEVRGRKRLQAEKAEKGY